jgi:hypothetical protein
MGLVEGEMVGEILGLLDGDAVGVALGGSVPAGLGVGFLLADGDSLGVVEGIPEGNDDWSEPELGLLDSLGLALGAWMELIF